MRIRELEGELKQERRAKRLAEEELNWERHTKTLAEKLLDTQKLQIKTEVVQYLKTL